MSTTLRLCSLAGILLGLTAIASSPQASGSFPRRDLSSFRLDDLRRSGEALRRAIPAEPDTIEIEAFLIEFRREDPDNPLTTGDGTFGSGTEGAAAERLEPRDSRREATAQHVRNLLAFAADYWYQVSGGRIVVEGRVHPDPSRGTRSYMVPRRLGEYSPARRSDQEKAAAFDQRKRTLLAEFAADAVTAAGADPLGPFAAAPSTSPRRHRAFLLVHAGASVLLDGGTLGARGADTPSDLANIFLDTSWFAALADTGVISQPAYAVHQSGLVTGALGVDTVRELLMIGETASQDGLNAGIAGVLVNQIGRYMGLPDTYDWVRGYSMMGMFDGMDFAGYFAGQGFLPVRPSAWLRLFMGWATPVFASPGQEGSWSLPAVRPASDSVLVIPLDDGEWLLVEHRRRAEADGRTRARVQRTRNPADSVTVDIAPDSTAFWFVDTLCTPRPCRPNPARLEGWILGATPDAGLPGSGLLVWKVNEWLLRANLPQGAVNVWLGDTLRDRYRGIQLLEADGLPALGVRFRDATGGLTFDYGSGADMLPHVRRTPRPTGGLRVDTVTSIGAAGWTSTATLAGGQTGIVLRTPWDPSWTVERDVVSGTDSVWTPGTERITVEIGRDTRRMRGALWPARLAAASGDLLALPDKNPGWSWIADLEGRLWLADSVGRWVLPATDTLRIAPGWQNLPGAVVPEAARDTLLLPLAALPARGFPAAMARVEDTIALRLKNGEAILWWPNGLWTDSFVTVASAVRAANAQAGPVAWMNGFALATSHGFELHSTSAVRTLAVKPPEEVTHDLCLTGDRDGDGIPELLAVAADGTLRMVPSAGGPSTTARGFMPQRGEFLRVASTDFDGDGVEEGMVLGSLGSLWAGDLADGSSRTGFPRAFARAASQGGNDVGDSSGPALADLDKDGRPEIVFSGLDRIHAVDGDGLDLPGWPVRPTGQDPTGMATSSSVHPAGRIGTSPVIVDLDGNGTPEVLVGLPDGLVGAWSGNGRPFIGATVRAPNDAGAAPPWNSASWPLAAGGRTLDTLRAQGLWLMVSPVPGGALLRTISGLSSIDGFHLESAVPTWGTAAGDPGRSGRLSRHVLGPVTQRMGGLSGVHVFPNPVTTGHATLRYDLGRDAQEVSAEIWEPTGIRPVRIDNLPNGQGRRFAGISVPLLGTGVYALVVRARFSDGTREERWFRLAIRR